MSSAQGLQAANDRQSPNDLESWWLPFTANRSFKARPRIVARAKDMYYYTSDGKQVMDGSAGLWCVNAGHNREPIVEAIQKQAAELDFAPAFQFAHPKGFGWPYWKAGAKSSSAAAVWIAETISSRLWPALQHHRPAEPSSTARPSGV